MVIITNKELEKARNIEDFKNIKRYVVYFSHYDSSNYNILWLKPYIEEIINSETFNQYMK